MGACLSSGEALKIKYIPGYEKKMFGDSVEKKFHVKKFHELGITMSVIDQFIEDCGGEGVLSKLTTREVCEEYLKPLMHQRVPGKGGSYAYYTYKNQKQKCTSTVRDAEVYVVHAWDSIFLDVVDTMRNYIAPLEARDITTFWFDMLCINQCHEHKYSVAWFETSFVNGLSNVNRVLVAMVPWQRPLVFERAWCLWELFTAIHMQYTPKAPMLSYSTTAAQYEEFKASIIDPSPMTIPYSYFRMVDQIDLNLSKSRSRKHRKTIIRACQHGHMQTGERTERADPALVFDANTEIKESIKEWVISEAKSTLAKSGVGTTVEVEAQIALANIYRFLGMAKEAIGLLTKVYDYCQLTHGEEHKKTVDVAYLLGNVYSYDRNLNDALVKYEYCLKMHMKLNGAAHPETLHMVLSTALLYNNLQKEEEQFKLYEEMLQSYQDQLGEGSEYTVTIRNSLANLQYLVGIRIKSNAAKDVARKQQLLEQADQNMCTTLDHWRQSVEEDNPDTLYMLARLAEVKYRLGKFPESNALYERHYGLVSKKFVNEEDGPHAVEVLESWHEWIISLLHDDKNLKKAEEQMKACLLKSKKVLGYLHPDTIKTRDALWSLWRKSGYHDKINQMLFDSKNDHVKYDKNTNVFAHRKGSESSKMRKT